MPTKYPYICCSFNGISTPLCCDTCIQYEPPKNNINAHKIYLNLRSIDSLNIRFQNPRLNAIVKRAE